MSAFKVGVFGAVCALTVAGAVGGTRWRRLEVRRAELNKEYEKLMSELRAFDEDSLRRAHNLRAKEAKTKAMHETIDTLWADRLARYEQTNLDLHAYVVALPESLGALKGLTNHYRYMSEEMRKFVGYDIACSKIHNLALLLQHGHAVGLPRVAETIREMFVAEPLVMAVCDNVQQLDGISYPRSIAEASAAFAFCLEELETAVGQAGERLAAAAAEPAAAQTPSAVSDAVRRVLRGGKLDGLSTRQRELTERRAALDRLLTREQRQLQSLEDVRAAVAYAAQVQRHFTEAPRVSLFGKSDTYLALVQGDEAVQLAVKQVALWRNSAGTYLMQRQAEDALNCYQLLLTETLTKVNHLPQ